MSALVILDFINSQPNSILTDSESSQEWEDPEDKSNSKAVANTWAETEKLGFFQANGAEIKSTKYQELEWAQKEQTEGWGES